MFIEIVKAEARYHDLLPLRNLTKRPSEDLIAAAKFWSGEVWNAAEKSPVIILTDEQIINGLQLARQPVFICGAHRSGTTLVRDLLDGHPDLVVLPSEGTFYTNLEQKILALPNHEQLSILGKEWLRRLANPINQPPYWLLGRSEINSSPYVDFARYVICWWEILKSHKNLPVHQLVIILAYASCTKYLNAKYWVDKTPTNERFVDRIKKDFPEAKIIHVVRNPISVLASRKKLDPSYDIWKVLYDLKLSFSIALQQAIVKDEHYLLLRYEELCEKPGTNMTLLARFLGIENSELLLKPSVAGMLTMANSSFNKESVSGEIYKWDHSIKDDILSRFETQLLRAGMNKLSNRLGYPCERPGILAKLYFMFKSGVYTIRSAIKNLLTRNYFQS